jgi:ParB-like chromosome segregation protein Spo0J
VLAGGAGCSALALGLKRVPVQYVEEDLSDTQEREFVIKDNLYRRHLSNQDWIVLYKRMYPNFEARVEQARTYASALQQGGGNSVTPPPTDMLSAAMIAKDTGQSRETVMRQLQRNRSKQSGQPTHAAQQALEAIDERVALRDIKAGCKHIIEQFDGYEFSEEMRAKVVRLLRKTADVVEQGG